MDVCLLILEGRLVAVVFLTNGMMIMASIISLLLYIHVLYSGRVSYIIMIHCSSCEALIKVRLWVMMHD